jgi:predicted MPP superfamily phosphohydrolase
MKIGKRNRKRRSPAHIVVMILAVVVLAGGFAWSQQNLIEPELIEVTAENLPDAFDGFRIAIVSDVHGKQFGEDNKVLLRAVEGLKPDLIAITGDLIERPEQLNMVAPLARGLADIAPTYYVTGNHEWAQKIVPQVQAELESGGVTVLSGETVTLQRETGRIFLMGLDDPNGRADQKTVGQLADALREIQGDGFVLLLAHRNNRADDYAAAGIDLTLAGHAHGGIIRLPFTDGLIGPSREWFPTYTSGLYELEHGQMVVSRGLGNVGRTLRLFNRPHLPLVILHSAA